MECERNGWILAAWADGASYWIRQAEAGWWQVAWLTRHGKMVEVKTDPDEQSAILSASRYCSP